MIAFAVALLIQEPNTTAQYIECLTSRMAEFEASQDAPSDIATAVVVTCRSSEVKTAPGSPMSQLSSDQQRELQDFMRETMRERVVTHVVRLRACRRTQGCSISDLPRPFGQL